MKLLSAAMSRSQSHSLFFLTERPVGFCLMNALQGCTQRTDLVISKDLSVIVFKDSVSVGKVRGFALT